MWFKVKREIFALKFPIMAEKLAKMTSDDFKAYVLYYHPSHPASQSAREKALRSNNVALKNIEYEEQIPHFLRGIPTLLFKKTNTVSEGTPCLEQLDSLVQSTYHQPLQQSHHGSHAASSFTGERLQSSYSLDSPFEEYTERDTHKAGKVSDLDIQKYMDERARAIPAPRRPVG